MYTDPSESREDPGYPSFCRPRKPKTSHQSRTKDESQCISKPKRGLYLFSKFTTPTFFLLMFMEGVRCIHPDSDTVLFFSTFNELRRSRTPPKDRFRSRRRTERETSFYVRSILRLRFGLILTVLQVSHLIINRYSSLLDGSVFFLYLSGIYE